MVAARARVRSAAAATICCADILFVPPAGRALVNAVARLVFDPRRLGKAGGAGNAGNVAVVCGNVTVGLPDWTVVAVLRGGGGIRAGALLVAAAAGAGIAPGAGGVFCPWAWPARRIPVTNTAVDFTVFMDQGFFAGAAGAPGFLATGFFW